MFDALRLHLLLAKARKLATLMDVATYFYFYPTTDQHVRRELLQARIVRLQNKTHMLAPFDAVMREYFPDIKMEPLIKPKVERKTFNSLKRT